ncbi:hypothetical protein PAGU2595_029360 [Lysobacter xanthus]
MFKGFGAELPVLSRWLVHYYLALWLVPAALATYATRSTSLARFRLTLLGGLATLFVLVPLCVFALYVPIFKLGAVVG